MEKKIAQTLVNFFTDRNVDRCALCNFDALFSEYFSELNASFLPDIHQTASDHFQQYPEQQRQYADANKRSSIIYARLEKKYKSQAFDTCGYYRER